MYKLKLPYPRKLTVSNLSDTYIKTVCPALRKVLEQLPLVGYVGVLWRWFKLKILFWSYICLLPTPKISACMILSWHACNSKWFGNLSHISTISVSTCSSFLTSFLIFLPHFCQEKCYYLFILCLQREIT